MVELRDYQREAVESVLEHWKTDKAALLVQATGTGKTIVFSEIVKRIVDSGGRVLILAHREELLTQALSKLEWAQGITAGIEKAREHSNGEKVVIGSVQTLRNSDRLLKSFKPDYFTHIIIDEAHHATANSYRIILNYFKNAKILGVTATPFRGDDTELSSVFEKIVAEYPMIQGINEGYLAPIHTKQIPVEIDLNNVHQKAGDFVVGELDNALDPYLEEIAEIMKTECDGRKTVVFLPLVSTSERFAEILNEHGLRAREINGKSPDRKEILRDFKKGKIDILCNAMLLTEGWDCPSVDCIVILRPTRSETLYVQMVGRGTRVAPGKENLLLLDFLWLSDRYDICKPSTLVGKDFKQIELINEYLMDGEEEDLTELLEEANEQIKRDVKAEREATLAKALKEKHLKKDYVDPFFYIEILEDEELINYHPYNPWEYDPVTENQIDFLKHFKIETEEIETKGFAHKLIDTLVSRRNDGLASVKQLRSLYFAKFKYLDHWEFEEASRVIGDLAANGWDARKAGYNPETHIPDRMLPW